MGQFNRATVIIHRSQRIAARAERHDLSILIDQALEIIPIKLSAFEIHLRHIQRYPTLDHQRLPWRNVSVMLELSDNDFIARPECAAQRARQVIDHRRRVRTEHDFIRGGIQKIRKRITGCFDDRVGFVTGRILPVSVGIVIQQIVRDGVDYYARRLRAAGAIKISNGKTVVYSLEGRKLLSDLLSRYRWWCVLSDSAHWIRLRKSLGETSPRCYQKKLVLREWSSGPRRSFYGGFRTPLSQLCTQETPSTRD